jgi:hypothetical protein
VVDERELDDADEDDEQHRHDDGQLDHRLGALVPPQVAQRLRCS